MKVSVRPCQREDLPAVIQIEDENFGWSGWGEETINLLYNTRGILFKVAEFSEIQHQNFPGVVKKIVGYAVYDLGSRGVVKIIALAQTLDESVPAQLAEEALVRAVLRKVGGGRRHEAVIEVRESNLRALKMLHTYGFAAVGIKKGACWDTSEDAVIMSYTLEEEVVL